MSASPSPLITSSSSSDDDDDEVEKTEAVTKFSNPMPEERLDCPAFKREDDDDPRVMVERPAGSNEWYQYYYETESYNEIKLRSPATRKTPEHIEWIDKNSSRLSRIGLSGKLWKYIKRTDGAWMPRGTELKTKPSEREIKKTSKKGLKKRDHATGTSTPNGNLSDQGNAIDESSGDGAIQKRKKSRLGGTSSKSGNESGRRTKFNKRSNKTKTGQDNKSLSSSDMDTDEENEYERNKAAMGALANWFLKHNDALTLKLPGTAESAGLEHITQKLPKNKFGGSGGGHDGLDSNAGRKKDGGVADAGSLKPLPGLSTAPSNPPLDKKPSIPKVIKNAPPLEDDDLFGQGGGLSGKHQWKGLGNSGSGHLTPMNSLPSVGKKEGMKSGGIPSRLGGVNGGRNGQQPQQQHGGGGGVKPAAVQGNISPGKTLSNKEASAPIHTMNAGGNGSVNRNVYRTEGGGENSSHGKGGGGSKY